MSTIKVRLKDASGNALHPETDWSVVQNKPSSYPTTWSEVNGRPSIEVDAANKTEKWNADAQAGGIKLSTYGGYTGLSLEESEVRISMFSPKLMRQMSLTADSADCSIKLSTKETNYNEVSLADYPINWSAIKNKPTLTLAKRTVLGIYNTTTILAEETGIASLAACYIETDTVSGETTKYYFYLNKGGTWSKFTPSTSEAFTPLTAYNAGGN